MDAENPSHDTLPEWFAAQPWESPGLPWDLHRRDRTLHDDAAVEGHELASQASPSAA